MERTTAQVTGLQDCDRTSGARGVRWVQRLTCTTRNQRSRKLDDTHSTRMRCNAMLTRDAKRRAASATNRRAVTVSRLVENRGRENEKERGDVVVSRAVHGII